MDAAAPLNCTSRPQTTENTLIAWSRWRFPLANGLRFHSCNLRPRCSSWKTTTAGRRTRPISTPTRKKSARPRSTARSASSASRRKRRAADKAYTYFEKVSWPRDRDHSADPQKPARLNRQEEDTPSISRRYYKVRNETAQRYPPSHPRSALSCRMQCNTYRQSPRMKDPSEVQLLLLRMYHQY